METLNSVITWFIDHCDNHRKLSPHTLKAYRHDLKIFGDFISKSVGVDGEVPISIVTKHSVQSWLATICDSKPRTIRRRLATVKSMFSALERQGHLTSDPLGRFRSEIKIGSSLPKTIARSTIRSLLRAPRKRIARENAASSIHLIQDPSRLGLLPSQAVKTIENFLAQTIYPDS